MVIKQYDIFWINLDPTVGSEMKKNRPCVIISPNEINEMVNTILICPITSSEKIYPTRLQITVTEKQGFVAIEQIRVVDKQRLIKKIGSLDENAILKLKQIIKKMLVD